MKHIHHAVFSQGNSKILMKQNVLVLVRHNSKIHCQNLRTAVKLLQPKKKKIIIGIKTFSCLQKMTKTSSDELICIIIEASNTPSFSGTVDSDTA